MRMRMTSLTRPTSSSDTLYKEAIGNGPTAQYKSDSYLIKNTHVAFSTNANTNLQENSPPRMVPRSTW